MSSSLPTPDELLRQYGRRAKKKFGQNFLKNIHTLDKIVAELGPPQPGGCIEIGPGPGGLTTRLLHAGWSVRALELDEELVEHLNSALAPHGPLEVFQGDALSEVLDSLWHAPPQPVIANLPYYVATPILFRLIERSPPAPKLVLMFQSEVADRIVNQGQSRNFSSLGVSVGIGWHAKRIARLPPGAFSPPPKVYSSVVSLTPRQTPLATGEVATAARRIAAAAFQQRRKMMRRSLRSITDSPGKLLESAGLKETARPEELEISDFVRLAELQLKS